jgi:CheY-like chemotaxis protein
LQRALAKHPADRQANADELRRALLRALDSSMPPAEADSPSLRVMVVDDELNSLTATRDLLEMIFPGIEVVTMTDAVSAETAAGRGPLDLIITDLQMPNGDGVALTRALRSNSKTADIPIVVMTAYGGASDWRTLRELGANRFLIKPVELDMLEGVVRALTGRAAAPEAPSRGWPPRLMGSRGG